MDKPYWYGVTAEFDCAHCGGTSVEKYGINSRTDDHEKIMNAIKSQPLYCRLCRYPTMDKTPIRVAILAGTRQSLFLQGYEVPEMPGDRDK